LSCARTIWLYLPLCGRHVKSLSRQETTSRKLQSGSNINASTCINAQHHHPFHGSAHALPRPLYCHLLAALMLRSCRPVCLACVASPALPLRRHCNTLSYVAPADEHIGRSASWWVFFYLILSQFLTSPDPSLPRCPRRPRPRHVTHTAMRSLSHPHSRSSSPLRSPSPSSSVVTALSPFHCSRPALPLSQSHYRPLSRADKRVGQHVRVEHMPCFTQHRRR
jgi:hypothetical protein